jgi:DNA gyrase subunit A
MSTHRSIHDSVKASARTTRRGTLGAVTSQGRLVHFTPVNLPGVPSSAVSLSAGVAAKDYIELEPGESIVTIVALALPEPLALGTRDGVVKRVDLSLLPPRSGVSLISLKDDDVVVGAATAPESYELVFITSDTQLLRFGAESVRVQGANAAGMSGMRLSPKAAVIYFTAVAHDDELIAVTVSTSFSTLMGTDSGRIKVTKFSEFPPKGRATGGVRAHALLKGEDALLVAWVGLAPAQANGLDGTPREIPNVLSKRDASGEKLTVDVSHIGSHSI